MKVSAGVPRSKASAVHQPHPTPQHPPGSLTFRFSLWSTACSTNKPYAIGPGNPRCISDALEDSHNVPRPCDAKRNREQCPTDRRSAKAEARDPVIDRVGAGAPAREVITNTIIHSTKRDAQIRAQAAAVASAAPTAALRLNDPPALPTTTAMASTFSTTVSRSARCAPAPAACVHLRPSVVLTCPWSPPHAHASPCNDLLTTQCAPSGCASLCADDVTYLAVARSRRDRACRMRLGTAQCRSNAPGIAPARFSFAEKPSSYPHPIPDPDPSTATLSIPLPYHIYTMAPTLARPLPQFAHTFNPFPSQCAHEHLLPLSLDFTTL